MEENPMESILKFRDSRGHCTQMVVSASFKREGEGTRLKFKTVKPFQNVQRED